MLFKDSDTVKKYAQLSGTVDMSSIAATLENVEEWHVKNILGDDLFESLSAAYQMASTEDTITPDELKALLKPVRKVIGPMLCYYYSPKSDVQVSDSGTQRVETATNKTAYQYQTTNFLQANLAEGEANTESLIQFLEKNKENYPQWTDSDNFKEYRSLFIKTGKEFGKICPSHTPYRNYYAMRAKMFDVEETNIRDLLGDELYDDLKTKDGDDYNFSIKELMLLMRLKKAIAYFTIAFAIPMLNVRIDANGLSIVASRSQSSNDKENSRAGAEDKARSELIASYQDSGETWIISAINFLKSNPEDFTTWKGFEQVASPDAPPITDELTGTFGMI